MGPRQTGVSLVETMVGITVGLITVLLITQIMASFQASRNSITFGADAQENGLFALQTIATDVREAGAGYYSSPATTQTSAATCWNVCTCDGTNGCTTGWCSNRPNNLGIPTGIGGGTPAQAIPAMSGKSLTPGGIAIPNVPLAPVLIEKYATCCAPGSGATSIYASNSDVLTVRMAARLTGALPGATTGSTLDLGTGAPPVPVKRIFGFTNGDLALVVKGDGSQCALIQVANVASDTASSQLAHASGSSGGAFNPSTTTGWPAFPSGSQVFNIGNIGSPKGAIIAREYSVCPSGSACQGNTLQSRKMDFGAPTGPDSLANGIVALRAQYGIAAHTNTLAISSWVGPDSATWGTTWDPSTMTLANMQLIRAVRLIVVARSGTRENALVTTPCSSNGYGMGPCPSGGSAEPTTTTMPPIVLATSGTDTEWQHYRYKVYTTVIPLRNVLWNLP